MSNFGRGTLCLNILDSSCWKSTLVILVASLSLPLFLSKGSCHSGRALFIRTKTPAPTQVRSWALPYVRHHSWCQLRFNEFGVDGGPAVKELKPKFDLVSKHIHAHLGFQIAEIEMKHVIAGAISLKGLGGILFIFGSTLGANLLALYLAIVTPIVLDFYNYDVEKPEFVQLFVKFTQNLALFGALLFFLGMKNSAPRRTSRRKATKTKTL